MFWKPELFRVGKASAVSIIIIVDKTRHGLAAPFKIFLIVAPQKPLVKGIWAQKTSLQTGWLFF